MLANPESSEDLEPEPESIDEFGGSDSDYSVPNADLDATSLLEELPSDAEFFKQPVKKGKGKQKAKGDTHALITTKRKENAKAKTGSTDDQRDVSKDVVNKRKQALSKSV